MTEPAGRWRNRRKMAWLSMLAGLLFPLLLLVTESAQLGQIATPFYVFVGMVVTSYIDETKATKNISQLSEA